MTDLLSLASDLVAIESVSHHEGAIADHVEAILRSGDRLEVERIDDSVVARTQLGRRRRIVLAGHLDTVPPFDGRPPRVADDTLWGLGAVDMKGGVAVLLDLALHVIPVVDVTYVLYACEEVERHHNALGRIAATRPELLAADAAVLCEPTASVVEAGCQGTMRAVLRMGGRRAHTARPWTGVNAVHRLGAVIEELRRYEPRQVELDGCTYAEQMQAVAVTGGVAHNVVPDRAALTINFRFAPDRGVDEAEGALRALAGRHIDPAFDDALEVQDAAPGARPELTHPVLAALVAATGAAPRAKLGWTDVATFAERGIPAANFGPGDPLLAHTPDEHVSRQELQQARSTLADVLRAPSLGA
jgi:succinyl-diaminopimelate desuccinylase